MPSLKAWYKVVNPREDLREGKPLDASECAVHLDIEQKRWVDGVLARKKGLGF
jgi:hypothetical protein